MILQVYYPHEKLWFEIVQDVFARLISFLSLIYLILVTEGLIYTGLGLLQRECDDHVCLALTSPLKFTVFTV